MCGIGKDLGRNGDGIRRKLICLGDSLTFGAGVTRRDCWTSLVQRECGWTVVNRGISGDTTGGMLVRLQYDRDLSPTGGGGNFSGNWHSASGRLVQSSREMDGGGGLLSECPTHFGLQ